MENNLYRIHGKITYNDSEETEDGYATVDIDEYIEASGAVSAFDKFLRENEQFEFYGSLKMFDADTEGKKWAIFKDQNQNQTINISID